MRIQWLGHASFLLTADDGTRIITDPFEANYKGILGYGPIDESAEVVLVSHEHGDHNYVQGVLGTPTIVRSAGKHSAHGVEFTGHSAFHDKVGGAERGRNTIFSFTLDGLRICHLGDIGHPLSTEQLGALGQVDVLLIPVGGPAATLDQEEITTLWQQISPSVAIPMHFKNARCYFPRYGVEVFLAGKPRVERLTSTEWKVSKPELPAEPTIVVLEPAR